MDHFVMLPMSENGFVRDGDRMKSALQEAMKAPFDFSDLFIYSHGWWTAANAAMLQYSEYTIRFVKQLSQQTKPLPVPPANSFGLGIHWPSTFSEDYTGGTAENLAQAASYYEMGLRAYQVGSSGVYAAIRLILSTRFNTNQKPMRITLIGHSFGCRVVCSALEQLRQELDQPALAKFKEYVNNLHINLVLLQAAVKTADFDQGGCYQDLHKLSPLRILTTKSTLDKACCDWFPKAETANNFAHFKPQPAQALGAVGPSKTMKDDFSEAITANISAGFSAPDLTSILTNKIRLVDADLTKLHRSDNTKKPPLYTPDEFGGNHSDIVQPQIYDLISAFAFHNW
jgi:hypothetical protein